MNLRKRRHNIIKTALILLGLLALTGVQAKEKITFYHHDAFGNIVAATDEQGEILWKEHYDPYGNRLTRDQAAADNRIWYTGHQENDFGLIYMGARHYDPTTGRFLQIDPMGFMPNNPQSFNRYAYANNNPYRYMDPNGESIVEIFTEVLPQAGRSFGALAAYGVGVATGDQALANVAMEGMREMQVDNALALASVVGPPGSGVALKTNRATTVLRRARKAGCCCFEPGTPVLTAEGNKPIETVDIGELVWAADAETGEVGLKPVTELFLTKGKPLYELTLATHDNQRETIRVTDNHPYRVIGLGWVDSAKLRPGMKVEGYEGEVLTVAEIRETDRVEDTYNLEVADYHTFYAGDKLALVHNCGKCDAAKDAPSSRAARRQAMRDAGIPTSQQPASQSRNASGREYSYDVPASGGGGQRMSVQQQTMDRSHQGQPHWEAGRVKTDPLTGEVRMNNYGRPALTNDKSKVDY